MKEDFTDFIEVSGLLNYDPVTISKNISSILEPKSSSINSIALSPSKRGS